MNEDILEKYEIGEPIANGGQGLVREARRKINERIVIIKQYSEMYDAQNAEKFWDSLSEGEIGARREINFLQKAREDKLKGVPRIIEYGITGYFNQPVVVFEPIKGNTLDTIVSDKAYIPSIENLKKVTKGVGDVLKYAHNLKPKPVVHRDIKPDAIFVNGKKVVLGDWATSTPTSGKTSSRTQLLTLNFTAPEITIGTAFDARADVYSLGKVMQYMLLGEKIFEESNGEPSSKYFKKLNVPRASVKSLEKATAYNPDKRYNTIEEFCDVFTGSLEGRSLEMQKSKKNNLEKSVGGVGKVVSGLVNFVWATSNTHLMLPTAIRKLMECPRGDDGYANPRSTMEGIYFWSVILNMGVMGLGNPIFYNNLFLSNPEIATPLLITQLATNAISGVYESLRLHMKKKVKEKQKLIENSVSK